MPLVTVFVSANHRRPDGSLYGALVNCASHDDAAMVGEFVERRVVWMPEGRRDSFGKLFRSKISTQTEGV